MHTHLCIFVTLAVLWRLFTLVVSKRNEKRLRGEGAREVGHANTVALATAHVLYYIVATVEWLKSDVMVIPWISTIGIVLYFVSAAVLVFVIKSLGHIWTVKIFIVPVHPHITSGLFKLTQHPNYFLNILPELVGFALALNSVWTLTLALPLYLIPLSVRIHQEEAAMKAAVETY